MTEFCQDCLYWDGDSSGLVGYCNIDDDRVLIGRLENCIQFLARKLEIDYEQNKKGITTRN